MNITETSHLRGDHHLWLLFLLALIDVSGTVAGQAPGSEEDDIDNPDMASAARETVRMVEVETAAFPHGGGEGMAALPGACRTFSYRRSRAGDNYPGTP